MIGVVATIKIQNGKERDFEKIAKMLVAEVNLKEEENLYYRLYKKSHKSNEIHFTKGQTIRFHGMVDCKYFL